MFKLNYNGIYLQPHLKEENSTMAYLTNEERDTLILFLLSPGLFQDAYKLASNPSYRYVYIFIPSSNFLFLSDVIRLQNALSPLKLKCNVIYPINIDDKYTNMDFKNNFLKRNNILLNEENGASSIKYMKITSNNIYNIHISINNGGYVFATYLDKDILNILHNDELVKEIHLFYTSSLFGGLTFKDIKEDYSIRKISSKIRCNGFNNYEEFRDCKNKYGSFIVKENYSN